MTTAFEKFKVHNDLDRLFAKGIDVPTCKRLLQKIAELEESTNWAEIDKDAIEKYNPKECSQHL